MTDEQRPPTEEELRAAYAAELKRIRVSDVLAQTIVSLLNLGGLRAGLTPDGEADRDLEQLRQAIEAVRALLPIVETELGPDAAAIREAISRLQLEYARQAGTGEDVPTGAAEGGASQGPPAPGAPPAASEPPIAPGQPGPAQRSGRLWIPGQ